LVDLTFGQQLLSQPLLTHSTFKHWYRKVWHSNLTNLKVAILILAATYNTIKQSREGRSPLKKISRYSLIDTEQKIK